MLTNGAGCFPSTLGDNSPVGMKKLGETKFQLLRPVHRQCSSAFFAACDGGGSCLRCASAL